VHIGRLHRSWALAWLALTAAFALHVADEALTGFLSLYNQIVSAARELYPWLPFPVFTFDGWLTMLVVALIALAALTPLVLRGHVWLRPVAYVYAAVMMANGVGHLSVSAYLGIWAPGSTSSPLLLVAGALLAVTTRRARPATSKS